MSVLKLKINLALRRDDLKWISLFYVPKLIALLYQVVQYFSALPPTVVTPSPEQTWVILIFQTGTHCIKHLLWDPPAGQAKGKGPCCTDDSEDEFIPWVPPTQWKESTNLTHALGTHHAHTLTRTQTSKQTFKTIPTPKGSSCCMLEACSKKNRMHDPGLLLFWVRA